MKDKLLKKALSIVTASAAVLAPFASQLSNAHAASITNLSVALSNESTSVANNVTITFTPNTAITNGSVIEVTYDSAFTGGSSLTNADVSVTGTNITSSSESGFVNGYFKSTLTTSSNVTTAVTITLNGANKLTNPASSGNYNFAVAVDIGGAGTSIDYGAGLAYVANDNDVTVNAVVPPVLDLELYQTGTDTELTDTNACNLGVLSLAQVKSCNYDVGFATNNTSGLTVKVVRDGTMNDGSGNDINAVADGTVTAGAEEYGFQVTDSGSGCSANTQGSYGTQDSAVPGTATDLIVTSATCNGTTAGQSAKHAEVTHRASMDTNTVVGNYDQVVTYTAFTN